MFQSPPPTVPGAATSAMAASPRLPTPDSLVNRPALAALTFTTESKGFRTFMLKFRAAVGPQYKATIDGAIASGQLDPIDGSLSHSLHVAIYDLLVVTFKDNDDVLIQMTSHCNALGPKCIKYLIDRYDSSSIAVIVNNVGAVIAHAIHGPDDVTSVVALNKRYPNLAFPDTLLAAVILLKMPAKFATIKSMILQSGNLPPPEEIADRLRTENEFHDDTNKVAHLAFAGIAQPKGRVRSCFNCDENGHFTSECTQPQATCDECQGSGHLAKHCLVRNDRPLPSNMSAAKKASVEEQRAAYRARTAIAATTVELEGAALQAQIDEDEGFLDKLQRLGL